MRSLIVAHRIARQTNVRDLIVFQFLHRSRKLFRALNTHSKLFLFAFWVRPRATTSFEMSEKIELNARTTAGSGGETEPLLINHGGVGTTTSVTEGGDVVAVGGRRIARNIPNDVGSSPLASQNIHHIDKPMTFRAKLNEILTGDTVAAYVVGGITRVVVVIALAAFVFSTVPSWYAVAKLGFDIAEYIVSSFFTIEYILRLYSCVEIPAYGKLGPVLGRLRYMVSFGAIVDLLAVLPFWIAFAVEEEHGDIKFVSAIRSVRAVCARSFLPLGGFDSDFISARRAVRLVRVFKVDKHNKALAIIARAWKVLSACWSVCLCLLAIFTAALFSHRIRPR